MTETVAYRLDADDRVVWVNDAWDRFASANAAPELAGGAVLGRRLWDFVADETTRDLYDTVFTLARQGRDLAFRLRCDAPDERRDLELMIAPAPRGGLSVRSAIVAVRSRPPQALLLRDALRSGDLIGICGWCKRIDAGGQWLEIEDAVRELRLFDTPALPALTHGICGDCHAKVLRSLEVVRGATTASASG